LEGEASRKQLMDGVVPSEVQRFVLDRIESIAQLEAILMMRNAPDTWWPSSTLAERLYIPDTTCRGELDALCQKGLVVAREDDIGWSYRYAPSNGELREFVDRLVYYYSRHLVPISNLIHAKPRTRIHEFADAFELKKKDAK
jgi:hypothetical protein